MYIKTVHLNFRSYYLIYLLIDYNWLIFVSFLTVKLIGRRIKKNPQILQYKQPNTIYVRIKNQKITIRHISVPINQIDFKHIHRT